MKTQMLATIVALSAALAAGNPAHAQVAEGANAPKVGIAVIDINNIFNEYAIFVANLETDGEYVLDAT